MNKTGTALLLAAPLADSLFLGSPAPDGRG